MTSDGTIDLMLILIQKYSSWKVFSINVFLIPKFNHSNAYNW